MSISTEIPSSFATDQATSPLDTHIAIRNRLALEIAGFHVLVDLLGVHRSDLDGVRCPFAISIDFE